MENTNTEFQQIEQLTPECTPVLSDQEALVQKHQSEVELAANELVPVLELPDDEFEAAATAYTQHREEQLAQQSTLITLGVGTSTEQFIPPTAGIISAGALFSREYRLDDPSIYDGLLSRVRSKYHQLIQKGRDRNDAFFTAAVLGAEDTQRHYFKNRFDINGSFAMARNYILADLVSEDQDEYESISALRDTPKCMERSVVQHNLLKVLGIPSRLETGTITVDKGDGRGPQSEGHAFLRVANELGEERLVDPENPKFVFVNNPDGSKKNAAKIRSIPIPTGSREPFTIEDAVISETTAIDGTIAQKTANLTYTFAEAA